MWLWPGFVESEFDCNLQPRSNSVLFVGRCSKNKGIEEFKRLASMNPDRTFNIYSPDKCSVSNVPNLIYRGELKRGNGHHQVFKDAGLFFMFTKWEEAFGRVVVEALSKGTPVIASRYGSMPELINSDVGVSSNKLEDLNLAIGNNSYNTQRICEYANKFRNRHEIERMVQASRDIIDELGPKLV